jgi:subtilase family serine protease
VIPKRLLRKGLPVMAAVALLAGAFVASAQAGRAAQPSVSQPAVNPGHVKVLAAALQKMHDNYASFANFTPGPQDIFDYNIGNLWLKGIDGSGTAVAVIEGWDDPGIAAFIHVRDVRYGLPDPVIQTIYPARWPRPRPASR